MHDGGILGGTARSADQEALARFSSCGGEYADSPLLIFDLRGNGGGSDHESQQAITKLNDLVNERCCARNRNQ